MKNSPLREKLVSLIYGLISFEADFEPTLDEIEKLFIPPTAQTIALDVRQPSDHDAGMAGFNEEITISFRHGGWDEGMLKDLEAELIKLFGNFMDAKVTKQSEVIEDGDEVEAWGENVIDARNSEIWRN